MCCQSTNKYLLTYLNRPVCHRLYGFSLLISPSHPWAPIPPPDLFIFYPNSAYISIYTNMRCAEYFTMIDCTMLLLVIRDWSDRPVSGASVKQFKSHGRHVFHILESTSKQVESMAYKQLRIWSPAPNPMTPRPWLQSSSPHIYVWQAYHLKQSKMVAYAYSQLKIQYRPKNIHFIHSWKSIL